MCNVHLLCHHLGSLKCLIPISQSVISETIIFPEATLEGEGEGEGKILQLSIGKLLFLFLIEF